MLCLKVDSFVLRISDKATGITYQYINSQSVLFVKILFAFVLIIHIFLTYTSSR